MSSSRPSLRNALGANVVVPVLTLALGGCMSMPSMPSVDLWPFGGESKVVERSRAPANATEYRCDGGKGFYLRTLEGGTAIWLIYPDRQVRLEKQTTATTGSGTRYTNGVATLRMEEGGASLTDGPVISYHNCKVPVPAVVETKPAN